MRFVQWQPPQLTGDPSQLQPLTATSGGWANNPTAYRFQWQRSTSGPSTALTTYKQFILNDAPLVYYRHDEPSGLVMSDSSGNGYTGSYSSSGVTYSQAGVIADPDTSVKFNGTTSFATMGIPLSVGTALMGSSWECWFRTTSTTFSYIFGESTSPTFFGTVMNSDQNFGAASGTGICAWWGDTNGHTQGAATGLTFADGNPHHLVVEYVNVSTIAMYLDGNPLSIVYGPQVARVTGTLGAEPQIGAFGGGFNSAITIDEFAVYSYLLTSSQVATHYQIGAGKGWTNIPGATSISYMPGPLDTGNFLRAQVTAININGSSAPAFTPTFGPLVSVLFTSGQDAVTTGESVKAVVPIGAVVEDDATTSDSTNVYTPFLNVAVSETVTTSDNDTVSSGTTGFAQSIQLRTAGGTNTSILTFGASASVPASASVSSYLQFPAVPPMPATLTPMIRLIIHNNSANGSPVKPTLLNSDNSLFNGNGGNIPQVEPGNRVQQGGTSWGTINVSVPGIPTANMKIALRNVVTGDAAGFSVSVLAWTA